MDNTDYFKDGLTLCHFFLDSAAVSSQTLSSLKTFTINKETTNEILMTPMSNTTIWTQTQTAGNVLCLVSLNW